VRRLGWGTAAALLPVVGSACALWGAGAASAADAGAPAAYVSDAPSFSLLAGGDKPERYLFYAGFDLWYNSGTLYGGFVWAHQGLYNNGPVLKLLYAGGFYRYVSSDQQVIGAHDLVSLLPGWRFTRPGFEVTAFIGADVQVHKTVPHDYRNPLIGTHAGWRIAADLWWEPARNWMVTSSATFASIGSSYGARIAGGWRLNDRFWIGPEFEISGDRVYRQMRAGAHLTGMKTRWFEWSLGAGLARDNSSRSSAYARASILVRQ